jgi:hypothetical protein
MAVPLLRYRVFEVRTRQELLSHASKLFLPSFSGRLLSFFRDGPWTWILLLLPQE